MYSQNVINEDQGRYNALLDSCIKSLTSCKTVIDKHLEDDEHLAEITKVKSIAKEYCEIDLNARKSLTAIKKLEERSNNELDAKQVTELYKKILNEDETEEDHTDNDIWRSLFGGEVSVMEVTKKKKSLNDSQYEEVDDDSLMCSNVFKPPVDPFTKRMIRDPYRNKKCGHVYESNAILNYIATMKQKAKCPYIGCGREQLVKNFLVRDEELRIQIEDYIRNKNSSSSEEE